MHGEMPEWKMCGVFANQRRKSQAYRRVCEAIVELEADGKKVTVRAVRQQAGRGSFSTICRILKQKRELLSTF